MELLKPGQIHFFVGKHQRRTDEQQPGPHAKTGIHGPENDGPQQRAVERVARGQSRCSLQIIKYALLDPRPHTCGFAPKDLIIRRDVARRRMVISQVQQSKKYMIPLTLTMWPLLSGVVPLTDYDLTPSPPVQRHSWMMSPPSYYYPIPTFAISTP